MADISEIKTKMKEDGFEFIVEITCFWLCGDRVYQEAAFKHYLFAKAIGNNLFYKIVDNFCSGYVIEQIEPTTIMVHSGGHREVNAKFKSKHLWGYFKLPTLH